MGNSRGDGLFATFAYAAAAAAAVAATTLVLGSDADISWFYARPAIVSGASAHWIVKLLDPAYRDARLATRGIARRIFVSIAFFFMLMAIFLLWAAWGNYTRHLREGIPQWDNPAQQNILMVGAFTATMGLIYTTALLPFAIAASLVVEYGAEMIDQGSSRRERRVDVEPPK